MKRNLLAVCIAILAIIGQRSVLARVANPLSDDARPIEARIPAAGDSFVDLSTGIRMARVTDGRDGEARLATPIFGSAFNANSTRFFITLDGVPTLYSLDPNQLKTEKRGELFRALPLELDGCHWSASEPQTIFGLGAGSGPVVLYAYDTDSESYQVVKDFSGVLPPGEAGKLTKSQLGDDHFAFAWRDSILSDWRYAVVWDRKSDETYLFDLTDLTDGVAGFRHLLLEGSIGLLVITGDVCKLWDYSTEPQSRASTRPPGSAGYDSLLPVSFSGARSLDRRLTMLTRSSDAGRIDVFIARVELNSLAAGSVVWTNLVNCKALSNTVQKTAGQDALDDASATSAQSISSGDGFVEFTASNNDKERWCGLSNTNAIHRTARDINFAIRLSPRKAMVCENGVVRAKVKYKPGNIFRIAVESGVVKYYKNGTLIYTSTAAAAYPMLVNASLVNRGSEVSDVMVAGASFRTIVSIGPAGAELDAGDTMQFNSQVTGLEGGGTDWSATQGTITGNGMYTAPESEGTYYVVAAASSESNSAATATVKVRPPRVPPVITVVASSNVTASGATITWTTSKPSDSQVEYGTTSSYGNASSVNPEMVTTHSITLSGLSAGALYHFRVKSRDGWGNLGLSGDFTFVTSPASDTTAPVITTVQASNVTSNSATVTWTTNEASDTQVEYGTSASYGSSTALSSSMVTGHSASLNGLASTTQYRFRVRSRDAAGNLAVSGEFTFTTSAVSSGGGGGGKTDYGVYPEPPPPALPSAGGTVVDPVFGTTILRVTDSNDGTDNKTAYSYWPSLNKDSTRLFILNGGSSSVYSFDPVNLRISNKRRAFMSAAPSEGTPFSEDAIWSASDPDVIYCHTDMKLWAYNVAANRYSLVKDFAGLLPGGDLIQMSKSTDDNVFAFTRRDSSFKAAGYIVWRRDQNLLIRGGDNLPELDEVQVDKSGRYLTLKTGRSGAGVVRVQVVNLQTRAVADLIDGSPDYAPGHSDNGSGIVVGYDNWTNRMTARSLATPRQFYSAIDFGNDWSLSEHISMLADGDQWFLVSTYVSNSLPSSGLFRNELFLVATDGSKRVRRLAHHHSVLREYWDSPRANISKDGRFAVFTSNWGSTDRRDVFIVKIPGASSGGGGAPGDTTAPVIGSIASWGVSSSGATINWSTNEASDTQVEYGTTTAYGSSTQLNSARVTSHSATLGGLSPSTLYHYRVKSRDAAGNLAVSGDQTFTTPSGGGGPASGSSQAITWTALVNCTANGNTLQKTAGRDDTSDAGGRSQQTLASGNGYFEFTAPESNKTRFAGWTRNVSGTDYAAIDFAIKLTSYGVAEVRENNFYKAETTYTSGAVFRIAVEAGVGRYYKNGVLFYTSAKAPQYPLLVDSTFISLSGSIGNAVIGASGGTLALSIEIESVTIASLYSAGSRSDGWAEAASLVERASAVAEEAVSKDSGVRFGPFTWAAFRLSESESVRGQQRTRRTAACRNS